MGLFTNSYFIRYYVFLGIAVAVASGGLIRRKRDAVEGKFVLYACMERGLT